MDWRFEVTTDTTDRINSRTCQCPVSSPVPTVCIWALRIIQIKSKVD